MEIVIDFIQSNLYYAPYIIFIVLLLAGFNLPISEDAFLFISAILAVKYPDMMNSLFIGVFFGCYISDLISYGFMGRYLGPKLFKIPFFAKMISEEKINNIGNFYKRYGIATLIVGRFIPFGVRNALFMSAGLSKMNVWKFAITDFIACLISNSFFLWLYYTYGESIIELVKKGNIVLFAVLLLVVTGFYIKNKKASDVNN